jgi:hypothetical protein
MVWQDALRSTGHKLGLEIDPVYDSLYVGSLYLLIRLLVASFFVSLVRVGTCTIRKKYDRCLDIGRRKALVCIGLVIFRRLLDTRVLSVVLGDLARDTKI